MNPCVGGHKEDPYWVYDGQGIPLTKVCEHCREFKLKGFRPEILSHYNESDVDERIEEDY